MWNWVFGQAGMGEGNQRLKCKMQNCGGPSGGFFIVGILLSTFTHPVTAINTWLVACCSGLVRSQSKVFQIPRNVAISSAAFSKDLL